MVIILYARRSQDITCVLILLKALQLESVFKICRNALKIDGFPSFGKTVSTTTNFCNGSWSSQLLWDYDVTHPTLQVDLKVKDEYLVTCVSSRLLRDHRSSSILTLDLAIAWPEQKCQPIVKVLRNRVGDVGGRVPSRKRWCSTCRPSKAKYSISTKLEYTRVGII